MRARRLVKYAIIAATVGGIGYVAGGGKLILVEDVRMAPKQFGAQVREATDEIPDNGSVEGALNYMRNRVSEGVRRVADYLDD